MTLLQKTAIHLTIIFTVVTLPVIVFEFMSNHRYYNFTLIGGITYFIYGFYLVCRIKNDYAKIIFLGILCSFLAFYIGIILIDISEYILVASLVTNFIFQAFLLIKNIKSNRKVRSYYLINFIITVILSIFFSFVLFLAIAASGLPPNHY